jgi:hypothetical protein
MSSRVVYCRPDVALVSLEPAQRRWVFLSIQFAEELLTVCSCVNASIGGSPILFLVALGLCQLALTSLRI